MRLAIVITVKNERVLLRNNIIYHNFLGVDDFYIYLDNSTDKTEETIRDLPYITMANSIEPENYKHIVEINELIINHETHHTARQNLNIFHTLQIAKNIGIDWVIALDADELICLNKQVIYKDQIKDFFNSIPTNIDMVRFKTLEVVPRQMEYGNVFAEETLFKLNDAVINHKLYDPIKNQFFTIKGFYGQTMGKSAVRTTIPVKPKTMHKFVGLNGDSLSYIWKGHLLHYNCYDFHDFIKKFRGFVNHPNTYLSGNEIEYVKILWRDLVNDPKRSLEELSEYYKRWIIFLPDEIKKLSRDKKFLFLNKKPQITEVKSVKMFFNNLSE